MKISAVILARNEERNIANAIESVDFCDEVLVIDDFSSDKTKEIASNLGAIVLSRRLGDNFARQRNYGLEKSKSEWVLFLDADEVVSDALEKEILETLQRKVNKGAYYIKRRDIWWGRELKYGETARVRNKGLMRLMKKQAGVWVHPVHETFQARGLVGRLNNYIDHYPHQSVKEFIMSINQYSTIRAKELQSKGKRFSLIAMIFFPFGKFIYSYFIKRGFLDGPAGFAYSFFMSFHSFLVRAKLYQYTKLDRS